MNDFMFMAILFLGYAGQLCLDRRAVGRVEVGAIVTQDIAAQDVVLVEQDLFLVEAGEGRLNLLDGDALLRGHPVLARLEGVEELLDAVVQRGAGDQDVFAQVHADSPVLHHHGQVHLVQRFFAVHQLEQHGIGLVHAVGHHEVEVAALKGSAVHAMTVQVGQVGHVVFRHRHVARQAATFRGAGRAASPQRKQGHGHGDAKQCLSYHRKMNDCCS